jgi:regulator of replication initiation timing
MNQFQLDVIAEIIKNGAPVLANQLLGALWDLVQENERLTVENTRLATALADETSKKAVEEQASSEN